MTDTARDDEEFAGLEGDGTTIGGGSTDGEGSAKDEEHLVFMGMGVPWKLSMDTRYLDELIVDLTYNSRRPQLRESTAREFEGEGMLLHRMFSKGKN